MEGVRHDQIFLENLPPIFVWENYELGVKNLPTGQINK
jgi:hypothetical protein